MIIFFSDGRLGNQVFQYAFLQTISKKNEKIIVTGMDSFLGVFSCKNKNFYSCSVGKYKRFFIKNILKKFLYLIAELRLIGYVKQCRNKTSALSSYVERKGVFSVKYIEANFFQSENFFDSSKTDFNIKDEYIEQASNIYNSIGDSHTTKVFIHVRRGDYLFERYLGNQGINLPKEYFLKAINILQKEVKKPHFIFLSDDPEFVECCFEKIENKYISRNSMAIDLALMSLCEYGIVSNSSFSWWGAYLMRNRKRVIFPKYWYGWKSKVESHVGIQPNWSEILDF